MSDPATDKAALGELLREVWEENTDESYRRDQSHWRGEGRWEDEKWEAIGQGTRRHLGAAYRLRGRDVRPPESPVVLEWGPGGGSNLYAWGDEASELWGVDISATNLKEAGRVLAEKPARFHPVVIEGDPTVVADLVTSPVDVFISTAVFQHFPSKEYGVEVLRTVGRLMAPNGVGVIQIRYDDGTPKYRPKSIDEYRQYHITATSYPLHEFWGHIRDAGLRPMALTNINANNNYAHYLFMKPE